MDTVINQPDGPQAVRSLGGLRRVFATLALSATLLVVGGAAVAFAASPAPSGPPAPAATGTPGGTTNPKSTHDCPNMGSGGTNHGQGRGTAPSPVTPTAPNATPSV